MGNLTLICRGIKNDVSSKLTSLTMTDASGNVYGRSDNKWFNEESVREKIQNKLGKDFSNGLLITMTSEIGKAEFALKDSVAITRKVSRKFNHLIRFARKKYVSVTYKLN